MWDRLKMILGNVALFSVFEDDLALPCSLRAWVGLPGWLPNLFLGSMSVIISFISYFFNYLRAVFLLLRVSTTIAWLSPTPHPLLARARAAVFRRRGWL